MHRSSLRRHWPMWAFIALVVLFLYLPLLPPLVFSIETGDPNQVGWTWRWYGELWRNPLLVGALRTTLLVGAIVAVVATGLGLLAAMAIRELGMPRLTLLLMLLPLFIPGVSMGLATSFLFRLVGIPPSLLSIVIVQVLWALPFATLVIVTVMSTFDPVYLEAAYMSGANRWRAFREIELPLIAPGVLGAAMFSLILSFNETIRTSAVQGPYNTVQTYIWSTYKQVGLSPTLFALMSLIIVLTLALVFGSLAIRRSRA